jgi:hypothetical protein
MAAWIGESGDGIVALGRWGDGRWREVTYGPYCGGVAAIPAGELVALGVPDDLAASWGVDVQMCTDPSEDTAAHRAA